MWFESPACLRIRQWDEVEQLNQQLNYPADQKNNYELSLFGPAIVFNFFF